MKRNPNSISWEGPTDSPDYPILMAGAVGLCLLGFASSVIPYFDIIMIGVVVTAGLVAVYRIVAHICRERRLDHEALYGPITEEEEHENVER